MSILSQFSTPAKVQDLQDPGLQQKMNELWSQNVEGFTQQGITGNPWTATYASNQTYYYDPLTTDIPNAPNGKYSQSVPINWSAFPGRIDYYFSNLSQADRWSLADTGYMTDGKTSFPQITANPCGTPPPPPSQPFGPYGPRGWMDEYSEWSVTRNAQGKITRVDFTCENPEYYNTLWRISPETVCTIYQQTLDNPAIQLSDLYLTDGQGNPINDPSTGRPGYNPLNKWNSGPTRTASAGGAMHLTSTPNTLQTEIGLASGATVQRTIGNSDTNALICCGQYGQMHRNSDPHIGQVDNQAVGAGLRISLTDPPGLYIQLPDFDRFALPANAPKGAKPSDYWTIKRGVASLSDQNGNPIPGNFFLHCVYEVPDSLGFVVGDITIRDSNGQPQPIQYGSQIAETYQMQINAMPVAASAPAPVYPCVGTPATSLAQPSQIMYAALWNGYYNTAVTNPVQYPMSLASNTVIVPPQVEPGWNVTLVLTGGVTLGPKGQLPGVSFPPPGGGPADITVTVTGVTNVTYAVPGNTLPGPAQAVTLQLQIAATAKQGLRSIVINNFGQSAGPPGPAFLLVMPPGSLSGTGN